MNKFPEGVCPILATTFTDQGEIDYASLKKLTRWLIEKKSSAITMFGIASEYYKLSDYERDKMIETVIKEANGDVAVIVSVTKHASESAVVDAVHAEKMGADMLMLLPPFFLSPDSTAIINHIESVCQAVKIPVMVQYAPEQTGVKISPETFADLAKRYPQICYKIECKPPGKVITSVIEGSRGSVNVYVGNAGFQLIEGLQRGAVGVMPGCSMPEIYIKIYDSFKQGRFDQAVKIHNDLLPLLNSIRQSVEQIIKTEKIILKKRGVIASDYCRKPTFTLDEILQKDFEMYYANIEQYFSR